MGSNYDLFLEKSSTAYSKLQFQIMFYLSCSKYFECASKGAKYTRPTL